MRGNKKKIAVSLAEHPRYLLRVFPVLPPIQPLAEGLSIFENSEDCWEEELKSKIVVFQTRGIEKMKRNHVL